MATSLLNPSSCAIAALNHETVRLILKGRFEEAMHKGKAAIRFFHELVKAAPERSPGSLKELPGKGAVVGGAGITSSSCRPTFLALSFDNERLSHNDSEISPSNYFSMFKRVYDFSKQTFDAIQYKSEVSAILLFNFALANHAFGITCNKREALELSQRVYRLVQTTFEEIDDQNMAPEDDGTTKDELFVVQLATLNNSGHVLYHLCQEKEAALVLEYVELGLTHPASEKLADDDAEFFQLTVTVNTVCGQHRTAPAA